MIRSEHSLLHTNQRLLIEELVRRGASVSVLDASIELMEVSYAGTTEYLLDRSSRVAPYLASALAADKHLTKILLRRNGVCVPDGAVFYPSQVGEALDYGCRLGFPLVVKPNVGSHGDGVRSGIDGRDQTEAAIYALLHSSGGNGHFVVERHVYGKEHRVFITSKGDFAVLLREPAHVVGDGKSTVAELAELESARRREVKERDGSSLCPIALDQVAINFLRCRGLGFDHVPNNGARVDLRLSSNLAQGGISRDVTDEAHPSVVDVALRALRSFDGLPCAGIDLVTADISSDQGETPHAVIEVNANPGLSMHHMPAAGLPRNVASYLADVMFPKTRGPIQEDPLISC